MDWFNIPNTDSEYDDLIRSSGEKLIYTLAGLYLIAHIIATLGFPQIFVPRIWGLSLYMLFLVVIVLVLIRRRYFISLVVWLCGLAGRSTWAQRPMISTRWPSPPAAPTPP